MNIDQSIARAESGSQKLDPAQKKRLEKAVREFESVFVGYMLKSMRNTVEKADNSTDSFGGDMLESMFDGEFSKHISNNSNLGLASMLYRKITGEKMKGNHVFNPESSPIALTPKPLVTPKAAVQKRVEQSKKSVDPVKVEEPVKVSIKVEPKPARKNAEQVTKEPVVATQPAAKVNVAKKAMDVAHGMQIKTLDERLKSLDSHIAEASRKFGVSDSLIRAVIATESAAQPNVQSPKKAKGLMQLIDSTASEMGVKNVWDPRENILGGAKYLKQLLNRFDGDEELAIASYNAGPGAVHKHGGVPPYQETKNYVTRVMSFLKIFEQQENDNE